MVLAPHRLHIRYILVVYGAMLLFVRTIEHYINIVQQTCNALLQLIFLYRSKYTLVKLNVYIVFILYFPIYTRHAREVLFGNFLTLKQLTIINLKEKIKMIVDNDVYCVYHNDYNILKTLF